MSSDLFITGANFAYHLRNTLTMLRDPKTKKILKWLFIGSGALLTIALIIYFYFATLRHEDTASLRIDYNVESNALIKEFEKDHKEANKKYADKIIAVKGIVTATEMADTTMNIKMEDTTTGSYLIFAFQQQHMADAKKLKEGNDVVIKAVFSDGIYSDIKEAYFINFQRSTIIK